MATISETNVYAPTVNRILATDSVLGGDETTPANIAAKNLADRTNYLKGRIDSAGLTTSSVYAGDLDSLLQSGFYFANSSSSNKPAGVTSGPVIVVNNGSTDFVQIMMDLATDKIYYRRKVTSVQSWVLLKNDDGLAGSIAFIQDRLIDTISEGETAVIVSGMEPFNISTGSGTMEISAGFAIMDGAFITVSAYDGAYPVYLNDSNNYVTTQPVSGSFIAFDPDTSARQKDVKRRAMSTPGEIRYDAVAATLDNFDGTGLGKNRYLGWALCNGSNGTVDLGGMFPAVYKSSDADYDTVGETGGVKQNILTEANLPSLTPDPLGSPEYGLIRKSEVGENVTVSGSGDSVGSGLQPNVYDAPLDFPYNGQDTPLENRPPYKVVVAMQRI